MSACSSLRTLQFAGVLLVIFIMVLTCFLRDKDNGFLALLMRNKIEMLAVLEFFLVLLIDMFWLDTAVELKLYSDASKASEY